MDLAGKYDKTNLLGDGEVQVWRGREKSRGTPVLLHTFTGSPKLLRLATEYLLKRPPSSPLLDIGEWDGATCLVTLSELDMLDVTAWLESAVTAAPEPPRPAQRVESTGPVPILKPDTGPVTKPAPTSPPNPTASPAPQGPGEFTRAFQIPASNAPPPRLPDPMATSGPANTPAGPAQRPAPISSPNPTPQGPGEFTRAFQIPTSNVPPQRLPDPMPSSGPAKAPAGPGEFTQLFRLPEQTGNRETVKPPELGLPPSPPGLHSPEPRSAGEFTRLFRAQPIENSPKPTFPSPELPAEAVPPKLSMATGPTPLPPRSAPPEPKGPGEYTRVMQAPSLQTPQQPAAPSPASAQAVQLPMPAIPSVPSVPSPPSLPTPSIPSAPSVPSAPSMPSSIPAPTGQRPAISPVVLLLGGLILVALILVLVFALRR